MATSSSVTTLTKILFTQEQANALQFNAKLKGENLVNSLYGCSFYYEAAKHPTGIYISLYGQDLLAGMSPLPADAVVAIEFKEDMKMIRRAYFADAAGNKLPNQNGYSSKYTPMKYILKRKHK